MGADFDLLPGSYEVRVRPDDPSLPPRTFSHVVEPGVAGEARSLSLSLVGADEQFVRFQGQLKLRYRDELQEVPAKNVRVSARSLDGLHTSNTFETCSSSD